MHRRAESVKDTADKVPTRSLVFSSYRRRRLLSEDGLPAHTYTWLLKRKQFLPAPAWNLNFPLLR